MAVIWKPACIGSLLSNCCFHQLSDEAFEAEDAEAEATALRLQLLTVAIIQKPACKDSLAFCSELLFATV